MCGLFGVINYGKTKKPNLNELVQYLGEAATVRGTHATGISYNHAGDLVIEKDAVSAYSFNFAVPNTVKAIMGHTRRTTQGTQKNNYNNHPFAGQAGKRKYAFAHNGVLDNERELRSQFNLPKTNVKTDSYVAVQLLDTQKNLAMNSLKFVGENVEGMFTFTVLDDRNNIHIIKNDSPLALVQFPDLEMYVYASTNEILMEALMQYYVTRRIVMDVLQGKKDAKRMMTWHNLNEGDILTIKANGALEYGKFQPLERWAWAGYNTKARKAAGASVKVSVTQELEISLSYETDEKVLSNETLEYGWSDAHETQNNHWAGNYDMAYVQQLLAMAESEGVFEREIMMLHQIGYSMAQIEDALFDNRIFDLLVASGVVEDSKYV